MSDDAKLNTRLQWAENVPLPTGNEGLPEYHQRLVQETILRQLHVMHDSQQRATQLLVDVIVGMGHPTVVFDSLTTIQEEIMGKVVKKTKRGKKRKGGNDASIDDSQSVPIPTGLPRARDMMHEAMDQLNAMWDEICDTDLAVRASLQQRYQRLKTDYEIWDAHQRVTKR